MGSSKLSRCVSEQQTGCCLLLAFRTFLTPPQYTFDFNNIFADPPVPWTNDPLYPTLRLGSSGQPAAACFTATRVSRAAARRCAFAADTAKLTATESLPVKASPCSETQPATAGHCRALIPPTPSATL